MTIRLVLALVVSTLDYCNSALVDLPLLTKFAPVQNAATRLVSELHVRDLVTACLLQYTGCQSAGASCSHFAVLCTQYFTRRARHI